MSEPALPPRPSSQATIAPPARSGAMARWPWSPPTMHRPTPLAVHSGTPAPLTRCASKVYAQRVSGAGVPLWTANGVGLCMVGGDQGHLAIAPDLAGGAIVAWEDGRGGSAGLDIYARRVDASGTAQWSSNGVAVCTTAGDQRTPVIVSDAAGGAIVAWVDYRSTYEPHIYARLVSGAGVPQWAADGVALCSAPGGESGPALVTDGAGGAIAAWLDDRDGLASDIYAQRVSGAGSPLWPTDGVALCDTTDFRDSPALVPDGAGGAIAAWSDYRSGYGDIYERRVTAGGATPSGDAVTSASKDQLLPAL